MKALQWKNSQLSLVELDKPELQAGRALLKVRQAGVCNTDLEIIRGYMSYEGTLGHEFVATVEDCEDAAWIGKRVVCDINDACRKCEICYSGNFHHCPNRSVIGIVNQAGAFADYLSAPILNLVEVPDRVSDEQAVFVEPLAAALEIQDQLELKSATDIAVFGDGKLGLLIAMSLAANGHSVHLVGRHPERMKRINSAGIQFREKPLDTEKFSVCVEATGNPDGFRMAAAHTKAQGKLVLKSTYSQDFSFNPSMLVVDEISIIGSRCGDFQKAVQMIAEAKINPEYLIDARFPLREGVAAVEKANQKSVLKVLLKMEV